MAESNNNFVVKPFAGNATNNGQFGSFDAGTPQTTNDVIFMQGLDAWLSGWLNATSGATKLPRLEEFQGIQRVFSQALININQYGLKPYLAEETYRLHAFVQDKNGKLYQSLEDNNIGNPLTDSTKWNNNPFNTGDFALKNGDENETFKVANATEDNQAVSLGQFPSSFNENGYTKLPNGLILQWGLVQCPSGGSDHLLPISFNLQGVYGGAFHAGGGASQSFCSAVSFKDTQTLYIFNNNLTTIPYRYFAIGY